MTQRDDSFAKYEALSATLRINKFELDEVLIQQPILYQQVSEHWSLAGSIRDQLEKDIKTKEAELSLAFRQMAAEAGEKTTEDRIKAQVATHPNLIKLQQEFIQWRYVANLWAGLAEAFQQRPEMIRYLIKMYLAGYYMDNSVQGVARTGKDVLASLVRQEQAQNRKPLRGSLK